MILLFTDFGLEGPYTDQVKVRLFQEAPDVPVFVLFADAPSQDPRRAGYLLAAYVEAFPAGSVVLGVVDPGVGGDRTPLMIEVDGRWYVGPDNGLFEVVLRQSHDRVRAMEILWRPSALSNSFHGRYLFAPVAASLAMGKIPENLPLKVDSIRQPDWPDDLSEVIYIDRYGNGITGLRAASMDRATNIRVNNVVLQNAATFSDVPQGQAFWYENSNGLVEVSANLESAKHLLDLSIGTSISLYSSIR